MFEQKLVADIRIETENVVYTVGMADRRGLFTIKPSSGKLPKELKGMFTSQDLAVKEVNLYLKAKEDLQRMADEKAEEARLELEAIKKTRVVVPPVKEAEAA